MQENLDAAKLKIQNAEEISLAAEIRPCFFSDI
jgi:hypothetical protein